MEQKKITREIDLDFRNDLCRQIGRLYVFHGYAAAPDNKAELEAQKEIIIEISDLILYAQPDLTADEAEDFFRKVKLGEFGTLYRAPSSLTSMFQQYRSYIIAGRIKVLPNID